MKKLVYDIFDNMSECIPFQKEADKIISTEVNSQLEGYQEKMSTYEMEELRDLCFGIAYTAKREWFAVGVCYAIELMGKEKDYE